MVRRLPGVAHALARASSTPTARRSTTRWSACPAGDDQVVVLVNDNSAGNDAIIVDESINSIEDLAGKTVAAEPGVVDHFLLLQGLDSVGLTEADIQFQGLLTADAAAAFSGRRVRRRRRVRPVHRAGARAAGQQGAVRLGRLPRHDPRLPRAINGDVVEERPRTSRRSSTPGT